MRAVMGGMSDTLADHEERIKELEGEYTPSAATGVMFLRTILRY